MRDQQTDAFYFLILFFTFDRTFTFYYIKNEKKI